MFTIFGLLLFFTNSQTTYAKTRYNPELQKQIEEFKKREKCPGAKILEYRYKKQLVYYFDNGLCDESFESELLNENGAKIAIIHKTPPKNYFDSGKTIFDFMREYEADFSNPVAKEFLDKTKAKYVKMIYPLIKNPYLIQYKTSELKDDGKDSQIVHKLYLYIPDSIKKGVLKGSYKDSCWIDDRQSAGEVGLSHEYNINEKNFTDFFSRGINQIYTFHEFCNGGTYESKIEKLTFNGKKIKVYYQ
jgi:hypothetical protein